MQDWIEPSTTIISDYWKAYDCLSHQGYIHLKANHSMNFKDPETGAHTNAIESSWRAVKAITSSSGRRKSNIPGNLARYMFYKRCKELNLNRTLEFYTAWLENSTIRAQLPPSSLMSLPICSVIYQNQRVKTKLL